MTNVYLRSCHPTSSSLPLGSFLFETLVGKWSYKTLSQHGRMQSKWRISLVVDMLVESRVSLWFTPLLRTRSSLARDLSLVRRPNSLTSKRLPSAGPSVNRIIIESAPAPELRELHTHQFAQSRIRIYRCMRMTDRARCRIGYGQGRTYGLTV